VKQGIHPTYYAEATVICACGNTWRTGSTRELIHTDVCSDCHPFYTGEQRIVDTEGQVDRFYRKLQAHKEFQEDVVSRTTARTSPSLPLSALELGTRAESALTKAGVETAGQALERLQQGEAALLAIDGFGRKSLADLKRKLRGRGFQLPEAAEEPSVK